MHGMLTMMVFSDTAPFDLTAGSASVILYAVSRSVDVLLLHFDHHSHD